jgi:hypothetical protein
MLYLAHCSFAEKGDSPTYGYFTYLVKAEDYESAVEQLRRKVETARDRTDMFDRPVEIYLDDVLEVRVLPKRGVIARFQAHLGKEAPSLSASLPADDPRGCRVIRPGDYDPVDDDDHDDLAEDEPGEDVTVEPFMRFGPKGANGAEPD